MMEPSDSAAYWKDAYDNLRKLVTKTDREIEQVLGKVLGYPLYANDKNTFPNATESDGVCVGDHVPETLAVEAARKIEELRLEYSHLIGVIMDVHSQHADDLCWLDIDKIFVAAGLPVPDRKVGDKGVMLSNCKRYIDTLCAGGEWKSYADMEAELKETRRLYEEAVKKTVVLQADSDELHDMVHYCPQCEKSCKECRCMEEEMAELQYKIKELEASADLRWKADMRAIKMWHDAGNDDMVWPDHADLVVWLAKQLEDAKEVLQALSTRFGNFWYSKDGCTEKEPRMVKEAIAQVLAGKGGEI